MIDHSLLHSTMTDAELEAGRRLAAKYNVASVCIKPYAVKQATEALQSTNEELQSTNEELESSKEEMQPLNEALIGGSFPIGLAVSEVDHLRLFRKRKQGCQPNVALRDDVLICGRAKYVATFYVVHSSLRWRCSKLTRKPIKHLNDEPKCARVDILVPVRDVERGEG